MGNEGPLDRPPPPPPPPDPPPDYSAVNEPNDRYAWMAVATRDEIATFRDRAAELADNASGQMKRHGLYDPHNEAATTAEWQVHSEAYLDASFDLTAAQVRLNELGKDPSASFDHGRLMVETELNAPTLAAIGGDSSGIDAAQSTHDAYSDRPEAQAQTLRSIETADHGLPEEHGYLVDNEGTVIWRGDGDASSISLTHKDQNFILQHGPDSVFTHNHPGAGGPLSDADVQTAVALNISEIRAATNDGFIYSLSAPPGGWRPEHWSDHESEIDARFSQGYDAVREGRLTFEEFLDDVHGTWVGWSKTVGASYDRWSIK